MINITLNVNGKDHFEKFPKKTFDFKSIKSYKCSLLFKIMTTDTSWYGNKNINFQNFSNFFMIILLFVLENPDHHDPYYDFQFVNFFLIFILNKLKWNFIFPHHFREIQNSNSSRIFCSTIQILINTNPAFKSIQILKSNVSVYIRKCL